MGFSDTSLSPKICFFSTPIINSLPPLGYLKLGPILTLKYPEFASCPPGLRTQSHKAASLPMPGGGPGDHHASDTLLVSQDFPTLPLQVWKFTRMTPRTQESTVLTITGLWSRMRRAVSGKDA